MANELGCVEKNGKKRKIDFWIRKYRLADVCFVFCLIVEIPPMPQFEMREKTLEEIEHTHSKKTETGQERPVGATCAPWSDVCGLEWQALKNLLGFFSPARCTFDGTSIPRRLSWQKLSFSIILLVDLLWLITKKKKNCYPFIQFTGLITIPRSGSIDFYFQNCFRKSKPKISAVVFQLWMDTWLTEGDTIDFHLHADL